MRVTLVEKNQETPTIYSFLFKPEFPWQFVAGQFLHLTVNHNNPDNRGIRRSFTICSSPTEEFLMITTRITDPASSFKRAILRVEVGSQVEADGPYGRFVLPDQDLPVMFITGGVGITPVRSMVKYATDAMVPNRLIVLFSNRTPEEIPFHKFFNELITHNSQLEIIYTITKPEESAIEWAGRAGRIDRELVQEHVEGQQDCLFYISGPTSMVENYIVVLQKMGIPQERIKRENFPGY